MLELSLMDGGQSPPFYKSSKHLMKTIYIYLSVALTAATLLTACKDSHGHAEDAHAESAEHAHTADDIHLTAEQAKDFGVETEEIRPGEFSEVLEVSGRILPAQGSEATVTATMSGIVRKTGASLTEGAAVQAGQALFVIDASSVADGDPVAAAQAELDAAEKAFRRTESLAAEHIISVRELEDARQRYLTAKSTVKSLGAAARQRTASSPIGGFIKNVSVKPGDFVAVGQPLATVSQSRRLQLRAEVPLRHFAQLARVVSANFRMASEEPGSVHSLASLSGRLVSRGTAAGEGSNFVPVTFEFDNKGGIVPGSFAEVYLLGGRRAGVLSLPQSALTEAQGLHFVYVQTAADTYRRREVTLGADDGQRVEIAGGLKAGERVVTKGATIVRLAASAGAVPEGHSH